MKNKKLLLLFLGIFIFMIMPKNVNAQVLKYQYLNSSLQVISEFNGGQPNAQGVRYIRIYFDDAYVSNHSYTFSNTFSISTIGAESQFNFTSGTAGINIGGTYVKSQPSSLQRLNAWQQSVTYYKQVASTFNYTSNASVSYSFLQYNLGQDMHVVGFAQESYSIQDNGNDTTQSVIDASNNIVNNNNATTQIIVNNDNKNTQEIINNQNANNEDLKNSQKVCQLIDKSSIVKDNYYLNLAGQEVSSSNNGITGYMLINNNATIKLLETRTDSGSSIFCFYSKEKENISCIDSTTLNIGNLTIPNGAYFVRFTINKPSNKPQYEVCKNGNQAINDSLDDLNNSINDSSVDGESIGGALTESLEESNLGFGDLLLSIIDFVEDLFDSTCDNLEFELPFVNEDVSLPCMSSIYTTHFPTFFSLYQLITTGLIAYRVILNLFAKVHQLEDPNYDKVEVLAL